ncbi:TIGR03747 family integrating conjugative element membrane protein [Endozoicomonas sp. ALC066]|uniref:TIGR03747 family integrating conjugative element membrane protein n=1 Tax=Endozoicomonas sp. ALC066 TaxID=3403078 RepID=UPI003BB66099
MSTENTASQPQGPVSTAFSIVFRVLWVLMLSLIISIIVEFIGMNYWWEDKGYTHAQETLSQEINYLNRDFKESILGASPVDFVNNTAGKASDFLFEESGIMSALTELKQHQNDRGFHGFLSRAYVSIESYFIASVMVVQLFLVRLSIMTLSMPLYLLFVVVGMADGLMQRDLRRWGGGRESAFVYHHAKRWMVPVFLFSWLVYLSIPVAVHPNLILLPFAAMLGGIAYMMTSRFKKYL